jgi:myo-inositol-1(or 4)-monophosphatase
LIQSTITTAAQNALDAAAPILMRHFSDLTLIMATEKTKNNQAQGLVTSADVESERAIIATIRKHFPDHQFLAEENVDEIDQRDLVDADHLWVIDPLDGTHNFAHGIPHFAISIAYYRSGVAQFGTILNVTTGDTYRCERGEGAFRNGQPITVTAATELNQVMLGAGFYYDRGEMMEATLNAIGLLLRQKIRGIRRFGTASLDLAQVATGQYGGFFEYTLSPWDFAAGRLLVEEAGGKITTTSGQPLPLEQSSVLASNGSLHDSILAIVSNYQPKN